MKPEPNRADPPPVENGAGSGLPVQPADEALLKDLRLVAERGPVGGDVTVPELLDAPGARFGPYIVQELLGTGGMSKVYHARHSGTGKCVALKLLRGEHLASSESRRRFEQEAASMARLQHPNIVRVFESVSHGGRIGLAMELVSGGSLSTWLVRDAEHPSPPQVAAVLQAGLQAARGMGAAHVAGLVHRDIKPSNLLLDDEGQVKVSDFGVARAIESTTWVTGTGHHVGTPAYMSPEQCKGEPVSPATDVYSWGVTVFELLTGRLPFRVDGGSPFAQMLRHISEPAPDPCQFNTKIPVRFANAILRCLEKSPEARFADGDELAEELEAVLKGGLEPEAPAESRRTGLQVNMERVRRQLEDLPQRSVVAWACRVARRVQSLNADTRVMRAIEMAESVAQTGSLAGESPSTRMLAHMQSLRAASAAAAVAGGNESSAAVAAARCAAASCATAAAQCASDAAADAVFALENALEVCRLTKHSATAFWRESQRDFRRLREARFGPPGTMGLPVPENFWGWEEAGR